jgi:hypothetical protein
LAGMQQEDDSKGGTNSLKTLASLSDG